MVLADPRGDGQAVVQFPLSFDVLGAHQREQLLGLAHAAQHVAAEGHQAVRRALGRLRKGRGDDQLLVERPTHGLDPTDLVDGGPDHGEIEAVAGAIF